MSMAQQAAEVRRIKEATKPTPSTHPCSVKSLHIGLYSDSLRGLDSPILPQTGCVHGGRG